MSGEQKIHGLDPMYFDRRRSLESALKWSGVAAEPRFVVDAGANIGQTLETFLGWWPSAHCLSLEPLPDAFQKLETLASKIGANAEVMNVGLSDKPGSLILHSSKAQPTASSFLMWNGANETNDSHRGLRGTPSSFELGDDDRFDVNVRVETLDSIFSSQSASRSLSLFAELGLDILKMDVQGWELPVLQGARELLKETKVVLTEWQFDDIYGQPPPIHELDKILSDAGFRLWDISHIYKDLKTMRTLWVDLIYAKPAG